MANEVSLSEQINELIRKADTAQKKGNYEAAAYYDQQLEILREINFRMMKSITDNIEESSSKKM